MLTNYNGTSISYDSIGNPQNWRNAQMLEWYGRNLTTFAATTGELYIYGYNADGIRTSKELYNANGNSIGSVKYTLDGNKIVAENRLGTKIYYTYDDKGSIMGMIYGEHSYVFSKNLQGDVIGIYNDYGDLIAKYEYSAFGEIISVTDLNGSDIANINPFRYRGYYYDTETELYYLITRYYDPVVGRFISADDKVSAIGGNLIGCNVYSYCFNNPIDLVDPDGEWPKFLKKAVKWVAKNVVKPVVETVKKTISKLDMTYSTGVNVSGTPGAWVFNGQIGASVDTEGNVAIQTSTGGGVTTGSAGVSITGYGSITNAPNIDKLEGEYYQAGGSLGVIVEGVPVSGGGDVMIMPDEELNTQYYGLTGNLGFGTPGGEIHIEWGNTVTLDSTKFNIFDELQNLYIKIMEW